MNDYSRIMTTDYTHLPSWNRLRDKVEAQDPAGAELMAFAREAGIPGTEAIAEADRLTGIYGAPVGLHELLESLRR